MSYLAQPTSAEEYGVVKVGDHIEVTEGVISLLQDVGPTADVQFNSVQSLTSITSDGLEVVTTVTPSAGDGISITNLNEFGPFVTFDVTNTGVLSVTAGAGITVSAATGNIMISSTGADLIAVRGTTTSTTLTATDEYLGVSSTSAVTVTLPTGVSGRVYMIKDEFGQGSGKITIQPQTGETVDGKNSYVISVPYQSVSVVFRAGGWWII
jgi:hypothetical protein